MGILRLPTTPPPVKITRMYNVTLSILSILHQLGRLNKDKSENEIDDSNTAITGVQI